MKQQSGFTLIEVLIAVLVLAVGLLGTAALSLNSLQSSQGASQRSQASAMAFDLAERIRANRDYAISAANSKYEIDPNNTPTEPGCASDAAGCDGAGQAQLDVFEWHENLEADLPDAQAMVDKTAARQYQISLVWSEAGNRAADTTYTLRVDL